MQISGKINFVLLFFMLFCCIPVAFTKINTMPIDKVSNKVVVITGITKGLGRALVHQFIQNGWKVSGCGISDIAIQELQKKYGQSHIFTTVNINNYSSVKEWANETLSKFGSPNIVINNAGLINTNANLWEIETDEFSQVITTNIIGTFNVIKAFMPILIKAGKGIVINISSEWGRKGERKFAPYSASKFAVEGLTQSLSKELPKGLITVSLDPGGGINTDMLKKCYPAEAKDYQTPEQWAKKALPYILNISANDNGKALTIP